jgi:hypothetical protein
MLFPLHRLSKLRALTSLSSQSALFNKRFEASRYRQAMTTVLAGR